jgi:hypothetical protein
MLLPGSTFLEEPACLFCRPIAFTEIGSLSDSKLNRALIPIAFTPSLALLQPAMPRIAVQVPRLYIPDQYCLNEL